jgi:protein tyrosine phosphatase
MTEWQRKTTANLRAQLAAMGQRSMPTGRDGFDEELDGLKAIDYKSRCNRDEFFTASLGSNISKNRFRDVLPNESTRVALDPVNERGDGDYINANFIDARRLFSVPFVYIAAQSPLRNTVFDFWRMIFENNVMFIVMLCAEIEAGKTKSERYWPEGEGQTMSFGPLTIELISENVRNDTIFRQIAVRTAAGKERVIQHMQYIRWPDQGIPANSSGLMEIMHALGRSTLSNNTPILVHCSGGIGRTGVFITIHIALALFQHEQPLSVCRIVAILKYCRTGMVQRKDQYLFCYYAVLRETEKMVWEVDSRRHLSQKMAQHGPTRRQPENRPLHPAQTLSAGGMIRSSLHGAPREETLMSEQRGRGSYDTVFRQSSPIRRETITTTIRPSNWSWEPLAANSHGDLSSALRDLQSANQMRRQTPSRYVREEPDNRATTNPAPQHHSYDHSPMPRPRDVSMAPSDAGIHLATPDVFRYSAQPVTPSEGLGPVGSPEAHSGGRDEPFERPGARPLPRQTQQYRSDVEDEIGKFDQSLFGVRPADPRLL